MHLQTLTTSLALAGTALSLPVGENSLTPTRTVGKRSAASIIEAIMPSSTSCVGRGSECTTADDAGPYLADSMAHFGITSGIAQAGILSLIAYESLELQYKTNQNAEQKAAGRGTSNQ